MGFSRWVLLLTVGFVISTGVCESASSATEERGGTSALHEPSDGGQAAPPVTSLAARLRPGLEAMIFHALKNVRDIRRESQFIRVQSEGVHQVRYGISTESPRDLAQRAYPRDGLWKALGRPAYDPEQKRVDPQAIKELLDEAFIAPSEPLLGTTAQNLYPVFRRRLRNEMLVYLGMVRLAPDLPRLEREFKADPWKHFGSQEQGGDAPEGRLAFYWHLFCELDGLGSFGVAPGELTSRDLGFWVRRFEDGTAPILGAFMQRVLEAYDPHWLRQSARAARVTKRVYFGDVAATLVGLKPGEFLWPNAVILRDGEEEQETVPWDGIRADPPTRAGTSFADKDTGDRLVAELPVDFQFERVSPDGKNVIVVERDSLIWLDLKTLEERRRVPIPFANPGANASIRSVTLDPSGTLLVIRGGEASAVVDALTGEVKANLPGFVALDASRGAKVLVGLVGSLPVVQTIGPDRKYKEQALLGQYDAMRIHPTGNLLFGRVGHLPVWHAWESGKRKPSADPNGVADFAFSPDGARLCQVEMDGTVTAATFDLRAGKPKPIPGRRWSGRDCEWLAPNRLVVHSTLGEDDRFVLPWGAPFLDVHTVVDPESGAVIGRPLQIDWFRGGSPDGKWLLGSMLHDTPYEPNPVTGSRTSLLFWSSGTNASLPK